MATEKENINTNSSDNQQFDPIIDDGGIDKGVIDAPNIKYDMQELKPSLIEQKKWDIIYKAVIFIAIIIVLAINGFLAGLLSTAEEVTEYEVKIKDLKPVVQKIEQTTRGINFDRLVLNKFLLENLFFVGDKKYEIVQKFYYFFNDPKIKERVGSFQMNSISLQGSVPKDKNIYKMKIKIDGHFSSFNKDLISMITLLNEMIPVVMIDEVSFSSGNTVSFKGNIVVAKNDLFEYNYHGKYKEINEILRLKEEYQKNNKILDKILADKDLDLKKLGINRLYTCDEYKNIIEKKNLIKDEDIKMCYDVENLIKDIKKQLDNKFNTLIKTANAGR